MPTKQEERFESLLRQHSERILHQEQEHVNGRVTSIFLYGLIVGLIISYAGILPYFAGVGSGFIFYRHFSQSSENVTHWIIDCFHKFQARGSE